MVYVTGDCHAQFHKFNTDNFPEQKDMTRNDIVIVCGDFGLWHDTSQEQWWLNWLGEKSFTLVFVDGNHENFDRLYSDEFPIVDFHGGKAHKIRENIYHLMRGYVFDFEGKKFFAFGGASSHDISDGILDGKDFKSDEDFLEAIYEWRAQNKMFRINHISWWEQELPSEEEMDRGFESLAKYGNKVDYVITHCCPKNIAGLMGFYETDTITDYFEEVASSLGFKRWYFGHYHKDKNVYDKFTCLYNKIERVL